MYWCERLISLDLQMVRCGNAIILQMRKIQDFFISSQMWPNYILYEIETIAIPRNLKSGILHFIAKYLRNNS